MLPMAQICGGNVNIIIKVGLIMMALIIGGAGLVKVIIVYNILPILNQYIHFTW